MQTKEYKFWKKLNKKKWNFEKIMEKELSKGVVEENTAGWKK